MHSDKVSELKVSNRTIVRIILWVIAALLLFRFFGKIDHVITLIFGAVFLALALNPVVSWVSKKLKIQSRVRATAVAYLMVVAFLAVFFSLVIPPLVTQTRDFVKDVPTLVQDFESQDTTLARAARRYHLTEKLSQGASDFASHYENYGTTVLNTGKRLAEAFASLAAVLVLAFMMLVEGPMWFKKYLDTLPTKTRDHHQVIMQRIYKSVTGFVNGQIILAAIAGTFAFIALQISSQLLNVSINTIALAGIVAVFGVIPLFGNPIAAVLVVLVCLLNSVTLGLIMAVYFVIYFFIENHTFQPYLQARLNELTPLMVFIAALVGVAFGGILGAVVAIPIASTIRILVHDQFERRGIGNHKA